MNFIELSISNVSKCYINLDVIACIYPCPSQGVYKTRICYAGSNDIDVLENYEQIKAMIKKLKD